MCQCSETGEVHFYEELAEWLGDKEGMCQCPETGEVHFYVGIGAGGKKLYGLCQCPVAGEVHFYIVFQDVDGELVTGVNALKRAKFISTTQSWNPMVPPHITCQCPETGEAHFYETDITVEEANKVSMP